MRRTFSFLALMCLGLTSARAWAQDSQCKTDADCKDGFKCEVVGMSGCAGAASPDGQEAPPPPDCKSQEFKACVPPPPPPCDPAKPDSCADGEKCVTYTWQNCPPTADMPCRSDDPNSCKPLPEPEDCKEETQSVCVPAHQAPCKVDSDCGPAGFTCEDIETCDCGGVARPEPSTDEGGQEPPADFKCECKPSGEKHCVLKEIPCGDDGSCPGDLVCSNDGQGSGTDGGAPRNVADPAAPAICKTQDDGREICEDPGFTVPAPKPVCLPKDGYYAFSQGASSQGADGAVPPYVTRNFAGDNVAKETAGKGSGANKAGSADEKDNASTSGDDQASGCSVPAGGATSSLSLLSLLALALFARRRRR